MTTGTQACSPACPANYGGTSSQAFNVPGSVLTGSVSSLTATTQAAAYSYNVLGYINFKSFVPISGSTTTGNVTINVSSVSEGPYTPGGTNNSITVHASASTTSGTITSILIYVDGSSTNSFNSGISGPVAPTLTGFSDTSSHTFAVKAFDSAGGSAVFSFTESFGPIYGAVSNMMVKMDWQNDNANSLYADEFDPRIDYAGFHYEFAVQCHSSKASPPNVWRIWDPYNVAWTAPTVTIPCDGSNGVKHSVWLWGTFDKTAHTQLYKELIVDGKRYPINQTFQANTSGGTDLYAFQRQLDLYPNSSATTTSIMYTSNLFGWFW